MNVFISWSGERSRQVAELLDEWIQCVIQAIDPWMSSKDIDRGTLWFSEISNQLADTKVGIICLTRENLNKPWILFEAGALAKGLSENRVCTFLVDLNPEDISTPLSQFNHTIPDELGMRSLIHTLNNSLADKGLREKTLDKVFTTYWPFFLQEFDKIIKNTPSQDAPIERSENEILLEVLASSRNLERRMRMIENNNSTTLKLNYDKRNIDYRSLAFELLKENTPFTVKKILYSEYGIGMFQATKIVDSVLNQINESDEADLL